MQPFANPVRLYTIVSAHLSRIGPRLTSTVRPQPPGGGTQPANK